MQALVGGFGLASVYIKVRKDEDGIAERLGLFAFNLSFLLLQQLKHFQYIFKRELF